MVPREGIRRRIYLVVAARDGYYTEAEDGPGATVEEDPMKRVNLFQADGALPNVALARLSSYYKEQGHQVRLITPGMRPTLHEAPAPIRLGSSIFDFSEPTRRLMERAWGPIRWGGTGVWKRDGLRVIDMGPDLTDVAAVDWDCVPLDYSLWPAFRYSLGFTQRGCRLRCGFCVVPKKEGKPRAVGSVKTIWRGRGHPKKLILLDNDFFGQPRSEWRRRLREIRGKKADRERKWKSEFRVCLSQGINVRMIDAEAAHALASVEYRDNEFKTKTLYTAWDSLGDEEVFKKGAAELKHAGIPGAHLMVYMLVGYDRRETWEAIFHRFNELVALGCLPFPMVFDRSRAKLSPDAGVREHVKQLLRFARWAITGLYRSVPWEDYDPHIKAKRSAAARARPKGLVS